jgi:hypothetical protein
MAAREGAELIGICFWGGVLEGVVEEIGEGRKRVTCSCAPYPWLGLPAMKTIFFLAGVFTIDFPSGSEAPVRVSKRVAAKRSRTDFMTGGDCIRVETGQPVSGFENRSA